jgi:hypothetical protein
VEVVVQVRFVTLIFAVLALAACDTEQVAQAYVPGKPVVFPVDANSYLSSLGKAIQINCKTDEEAIEKACISRLESRMSDCAKDRPAVLKDQEHAKRVGASYMNCVMPNPICKGIEIRSQHHFEKHCKAPS